MNLSSLEIFEAVAKHTSVTKAATFLGRVPSNVTARIQQLEADLEVALFDRGAKRMTLTAEGEIFRDYAKRLVAVANEAKHAVRPKRPSGKLILGTMESTAVSRLPDALSRYRTLFPDVSLRLETGATLDLVMDVLSGKLDCALVARPTSGINFKDEVAIPELKALDGEQVFDEEVLLVLPSGHLPIRDRKDLKVANIAALETGCTYRRMAEAWGGTSLTTTEVSSYHSILASVTTGTAAGVMPRSVCDRLQWPVQPSTFTLGWAHTILVWRTGEPSLQVQALRELLIAKSSADTGRRSRY